MSLRELSVQAGAHGDAIWSVDWRSGLLLSGGVDETLKVWEAASSSDETKPASAQPKYIASAQTIINPATQPDQVLPLSASLSLLTVLTLPSGLLVTSSMDGMIRVYDAEKLESRRIEAGPLECWTLAADPSGEYLATGSQKGLVNIFSVSTGEKVATLVGDKAKEGEGASAWVMSVAWSADGRYLAAGHFDGRVTLFAMEGAQAVGAPKPLTAHTKAVRALRFSADSALLFSGADDMHVHWYEIAAGTGQMLHDLFAHQSWVTGIALPPATPAAAVAASRFFATVSTDRKVKVWNVDTKECVASQEVDSSAWCVAFDEDGEKLVVGTEKGTLATFKVSVQ